MVLAGEMEAVVLDVRDGEEEEDGEEGIFGAFGAGGGQQQQHGYAAQAQYDGMDGIDEAALGVQLGYGGVVPPPPHMQIQMHQTLQQQQRQQQQHQQPMFTHNLPSQASAQSGPYLNFDYPQVCVVRLFGFGSPWWDLGLRLTTHFFSFLILFSW